MSEIKNYQDLLRLKAQLESELLIQREVIRLDVLELKRELKPVATLLSGLGRIPSKVITHPLLSMGIGILGEVLVKNTLLGRRWGIVSPQSAQKRGSGGDISGRIFSIASL